MKDIRGVIPSSGGQVITVVIFKEDDKSIAMMSQTLFVVLNQFCSLECRSAAVQLLLVRAANGQ
jgi:hypothetical protein